MSIQVPNCNDDEWLREQIRSLRYKVEEVIEVEDNEDSFKALEKCINILDALQEYAGY